MLEALLKEKQEKINRLEAFETYWKEKEIERKSKQVKVESKHSWHYDENGKVVIDIKNTKEEMQEMGRNIVSDIGHDMGYQIAKGVLRDEVEKVERKIRKLSKVGNKIASKPHKKQQKQLKLS